MRTILANLILIIMGLELAITKQIVEEKHNGTLSVISKLGQGTEFIITLPLENT
jgi:signal transduction histidine kinase